MSWNSRIGALTARDAGEVGNSAARQFSVQRPFEREGVDVPRSSVPYATAPARARPCSESNPVSESPQHTMSSKKSEPAALTQQIAWLGAPHGHNAANKVNSDRWVQACYWAASHVMASSGSVKT